MALIFTCLLMIHNFIFLCDKSNLNNVVKNAEKCAQAIENWMTLNKLKFNDGKTGNTAEFKTRLHV